MAQDALMGRVLDGYRIDRLLGQGGMARVYRGIDDKLNRYVAIKIIDPKSGNNAEYRKRFEAEARAIAALRHPNIVGIYRFGDDNGLYYMVMEHIDGPDLHGVLEDYRQRGELIPHTSLLKIFEQVAKGLDYAHKQNVIHRDVKPSNIMLNSQGDAILTDFGLVLVTTQATQGEVFGSPLYIAPEQAMSSAAVVPQSDLYALGVTLYEALTGRVPFNTGSSMQIAMAHISDPLPDPLSINPLLSPAFVSVLETALAKEPEQRYATGAKLVAALRSAISDAKKSGALTRPASAAANTPRQATTFAPPGALQLSQMEVPERIQQFYKQDPLTPMSPPLPAPVTHQESAAVAQPSHRRFPLRVRPIQKPARQPRHSSPLRAVLLLLIVLLSAATGAFLVLNNRLPSESRVLPRPPLADTTESAFAPVSGTALMVDGVVRAVDGATLTIYDVRVTLPAGIALLSAVKVGDSVRLEGSYRLEEDGSLVFSVLKTALLNGKEA
ncbi:MAG: serine/threonine protein kinase [Armatimonadetes bacterium]|nr:serine/threonine protein kinase [Anaerolineae bacterium]